ncbi:MAG: hypothetical protein KKD33_08420, partial [Verrucomicrobia bacterium]|nr:hypothetical protein [Verrucomicrobiota bacterium]
VKKLDFFPGLSHFEYVLRLFVAGTRERSYTSHDNNVQTLAMLIENTTVLHHKLVNGAYR